MAPTARPSDIYGPPGQPDQTRAPARDAATDEGGSRRRLPLLVGGLILAFIAAGLLLAPDELDGQAGVVDETTEEQAIAALSLFAAQVEVQDRLTPQGSLYGPPGPDTIVRASVQGRAQVRDRLARAREVFAPSASAQRYWGSAEHDELLVRLGDAQNELELVTLLAAIHATVYDGAGQVELPRAVQQLQSRISLGPVAEPLMAWAQALLAETDGADAAAPAAHHRSQVDTWWRQRTEQLRPVELDALRAYVETLAPPTVRGIEGHPVAGPALDRLLLGR